ncbi:hypothetical protein AMEX_G12351 [Astyanax mexicanus]|uniref:SWIM-type domain-containing protein n=3 Tax=Astyanax mexicanus TaxID=7994 RepID=A0A8T2LQR7_ASTMX|nr:hypothetical protein AMEX_G12351 [Astyanax mexicanus]
MLRRNHLDKDDAISSAKLLTSHCKEHVVFFQPFSPENDLIIILQTPTMRDGLHRHGKNIVFMDATYCTNQYNFPLFTLAVKDEYGHGVPIAYMITSSEKQATLELALQKLRHTFLTPPRCFMVDKDLCEINGLRAVFPESDVLLCWYHVMQAVVRWISKTESGVSGFSNGDIKKDIISFFSKLKSCATRHDFETMAKLFQNRFEEFPALCTYFRDHWLGIGDMWSDFGRCYNHAGSDTNNLVERFFHRLKYQFLGGLRNRRLDDLINVLLKKTDGYFQVIHGLQSAGRIKNASMKSDDIHTSACRLVEKGWIDRIDRISQEMYIYNVPSEQTHGLSYKVCPSESFCSCPEGIRGRKCKHLVALGLLNELDAEKFPNLNCQMNAHASMIKQKKLYSVLCFDTKEVDVQSLCSERTFHTSATTFLCTCCTYSYNDNCACLLLACELFDVTRTTTTPTPCKVNTLFHLNVNTAVDCTATVLEKLNKILETVQEWQTVPQPIQQQIEKLHDTVTNANRAVHTFPAVTSDVTRKIKPLFPHRSKNIKRKYRKHIHK